MGTFTVVECCGVDIKSNSGEKNFPRFNLLSFQETNSRVSFSVCFSKRRQARAVVPKVWSVISIYTWVKKKNNHNVKVIMFIIDFFYSY